MPKRPFQAIVAVLVAVLVGFAVVLSGCATSMEEAGDGSGTTDAAVVESTTTVAADPEPDRPIQTLAAQPEAEVASACLEQSTGEPPAFDPVGVLANAEGFTYCVGPALSIGIESATARATGSGPAVEPILTTVGIETFNALAAECFEQEPACPTRQVAIVVDGAVLAAPQVNPDRFERDQLVISGTFELDEAERVASAMAAAKQLEVRPVLLDLGPDLGDTTGS